MESKNITVSLRIDSLSFESFKRRYPRVFSDFVRKALSKAVNDKSFFDLVYFGDCNRLLDGVDNCID